MPLTLSLMLIASLVAVSVLAFTWRQAEDVSRRVYGLCAALCGLLFLLTGVHHGAESPSATLPIGLPWIGMHFRIDVLSAFFLAVVNLGGAAASIYALGYGEHESSRLRVLPFYPLFLAGMNLVLMADDAFTFLVAWEFMSVSSWALVVAHHRVEENRRAGFVYIVMASFGALALLMAFGLLAGSVGGYEFAAMRAAAHAPWVRGLVLALTLLGAGSKAGLAPLHIWLPLAHPAAPSHVSALMSGAMTKVAIYGAIRIIFDLMGPPAFWWSLPLLTLGAATAVLGVLFATIQSDLKKLLAYSTIENIGIIFIALGLALAFKSQGLAFAAALAFTAALFHIFNHSLFKSLLFFGAGAIQQATSERNIERLGGLIHAMPRTAFLFLGGCVAISGLPPLNGFASEWLMFQAILLSPSMTPWVLKLIVPAVGVALAFSVALSAACFVRAYGVAFLGRARSFATGSAYEAGPWLLGSMAGLLALCLIAGLLPGVMIDAISPVARAFVGGELPVQSALSWLSIAPIAESRSSYSGFLAFLFILFSAFVTYSAAVRLGSHRARRSSAWDCGFPDPRPETQYTASGFAQPVRRVFGGVVFLARDHLVMPAPGDTQSASFNLEIRDRVVDGIYRRIVAIVGSCASGLDRLHLLTIRGYLTLVFSALVLLLTGTAIWR